MFERFGEFDSAEEINKKAEDLLKEGDTDGIRVLAEENGLDEEDAEDYITGVAKELTTVYAAAVGKLEAEEEELGITGIMGDWAGNIKDMCLNRVDMPAAVRRKDKKLAECMSRLIRYSFENKVRVSDKIADITKVMHNGREESMRKPLYLGFPDRTAAKKIIQEYYLG